MTTGADTSPGTRRAGRVVWSRPLAYALALCVVTLSLNAQTCSPDAKPLNLSLKFKDISGKSVTLSDYKGKVMVIDFWATWCPPCRKEIPGLIALNGEYKSRGLIIVGVSMDDSTPDIKKFSKKIGMNYPILICNGHTDLEPAFGQLPLPNTFVISRDGKICFKHEGLTEKDDLEKEISSLF